MYRVCLLLAVALMSLGSLHTAAASNGTGKELAVLCNPQSEADGDALTKALLAGKLDATAQQHSAGAERWLQCEAYLDGFIRGYNMAFQVGMGFTEYHLKQDHGVTADDAELRQKAAQELGLWYLCLPKSHSASLEAHVVSDYLAQHPKAQGELSEDVVKAAFDAAFTKADGGCR